MSLSKFRQNENNCKGCSEINHNIINCVKEKGKKCFHHRNLSAVKNDIAKHAPPEEPSIIDILL